MIDCVRGEDVSRDNRDKRQQIDDRWPLQTIFHFSVGDTKKLYTLLMFLYDSFVFFALIEFAFAIAWADTKKKKVEVSRNAIPRRNHDELRVDSGVGSSPAARVDCAYQPGLGRIAEGLVDRGQDITAEANVRIQLEEHFLAESGGEQD